MSTTDTGANQSAATTTSAGSTDQSASATTTQTTATESTTETNQSHADLERELDDQWGIPHKDDAEEEPVADETETEEDVTEEIPADEDGTPTEEDQPEETTETEPPAQQPNTLRVNYMGQAYDLPEDDARKYAQIGMNAGRLQEKYDALKPLEKLRDAVEVMALFKGQDVQKVIDDFANMDTLRDSEIKALVDSGSDEAVANELYSARVKEAQQKHEIERMKRGETKGLTQYQRDQIDAFAKFRPKEHANVTAGKPLPQEVVDEWRTGTDLSTAWLLYENKGIAQKYSDAQKKASDLEKQLDETKKENAKLRKNAENKTKAPTRKKGTGGGAGHDNPYAGWDKF